MECLQTGYKANLFAASGKRQFPKYNCSFTLNLKEKRMNEFGITILRFSDEQVLKDMENVIRVIEFYIYEYEKHTPNPNVIKLSI